MDSIKEMLDFINSDKTYCLYHKNHLVLKFVLNGNVIKSSEVSDKDLVPYYLNIDKDLFNYELVNWIDSRLIPVSREKYERLKEIYKGLNRLEFRLKVILDNYAASLTDCYWIKNIDDEMTWDKINYFDNNFDNNLIDILIETPGLGVKDNISRNPSFALDGHLPKTWIIESNKRILLKAGSNDEYGENTIELKVADILRNTGINHVNYQPYKYKANTYVACECFTSKEFEFISARDLYIKLFASDEVNYTRLINSLNAKLRKQLEDMVYIDYILFNKDRHWGNFGFMRETETLAIRELAPLFDNGQCLYFNAGNSLGSEIHSSLINDNSEKLLELKTFNQDDNLQLFENIISNIQNEELRELIIERKNRWKLKT